LIWRFIYKFVDYNFVNARVILKYIKDKKILNDNKLELLENSIDLNRFNYKRTRDLRNIYDIDKNKVVIGSIVNFRPEKDIFSLIKISNEIINYDNNVLFIFAGDGPLRSKLETYVKKNDLQKYIIFSGYISKMESFIASCDIIMLSNYAVGVSNSHLEAMAMTKPVVTFNPGELETLINDGINGFLIPPGDFQLYTEKIITLISDKRLRLKLGYNAYKTVYEKYNIKKWAEKVLKIYKEI